MEEVPLKNETCNFFEILKNIKKMFPELWEKIKKLFQKVEENLKNSNENSLKNNKENDDDYKNLDEYNHYNYNNQNYIEIQVQNQMQASKQKLKQLESQTYSNRTMARLISVAELYALSLKCNNDQLYKKFDEFDNLKRKTQDELKGELILQIQCFTVSYKSYIKKYKQYDFPDDYDEEKTLEELENIKNNINEADKKYYQAIIKLLKGDTNVPSFDDDLEELEKNEPDTKDPKLQILTDIPIMRHLDGIRKDLKNKYLEDPMNCRIKLNLDEPMEKNEEFENLIKKLDYIKKEKDLKSKTRNRSKSLNSSKNKDVKTKIEIEFDIKKSKKKSSSIPPLRKNKLFYEYDNNSDEEDHKKELNHHHNHLECNCTECLENEEDLK